MAIVIRKGGKEMRFEEYLHSKKEREKTLPKNKIRVNNCGFVVSDSIGDKYALIQRDGEHAKIGFFKKIKEMDRFTSSILTQSYRETSKFSARQYGNYYYRTDTLYLGFGKGDFTLKEDNGFLR